MNQIPTNILKEDNWDTRTWPHLHPDGLYGLHHPDRETKLTNLQYFQQRILNWDDRFSKNPSFLFLPLSVFLVLCQAHDDFYLKGKIEEIWPHYKMSATYLWGF